MAVTAKKSTGGGLQPPPPMPSQQVCWTFMGAFVTMTILATITHIMQDVKDTGYGIILGPFGALLTLQYVSVSPRAAAIL